jgi:5-methylcytosine-specific restriction endonuclease McrA
MSPTWKAALGVIVIFILGWFGGALTTLIIAHNKLLVLARGDTQAMTTMLVRQTTHGLKIDENQRAQLRALIQENVKQRKQLQQQIQPQVWTLNRQTMLAINNVLPADQQQKFQENLQLFKTRFGRNPLNTGPDDSAASSLLQPAGTGTNTPAGNPLSQ